MRSRNCASFVLSHECGLIPCMWKFCLFHLGSRPSTSLKKKKIVSWGNLLHLANRVLDVRICKTVFSEILCFGCGTSNDIDVSLRGKKPDHYDRIQNDASVWQK